jgi:O-methyltransferase
MLMKVLEKGRSAFPALVYRLLQVSNNAITADARFMDLWWQLVREGRTVLSIREAYNIRHYLAGSVSLGGAVAELGVYKGGGSKLICEFKDGLSLHLFDTFEGMPDVDSSVDLHRKGDFSDTSLGRVQEYLQEYADCRFHPGFFPASAAGLPEDLEFCFVHLDVDIYESTRAGLEYFYPRLKPGGTLISHDYNAASCPGVKKAFAEYFTDRPEDVMVLWDTQCMVRKPI